MLYVFMIAAAVSCDDYSIRNRHLDEQFRVGTHNAVIVEDAKHRFRVVAANEKEVEVRFPIVIWAFGERCVTLRLRPGYIGGEPTYCYKMDSDEFIRADETSE